MPRAHMQLVRFKVVAGHQLYKPHNEHARIFCNAIYAEALNVEHLTIATKLGFSIQILEAEQEARHG